MDQIEQLQNMVKLFQQDRRIAELLNQTIAIVISLTEQVSGLNERVRQLEKQLYTFNSNS